MSSGEACAARLSLAPLPGAMIEARLTAPDGAHSLRTRYLVGADGAREYRPLDDVRVGDQVAVAAGDTLQVKARNALGEPIYATPAIVADKMAQGAPLRRLGDDEDLKGLALLYASDAGKHITGQWMAVDGGVSAIIGG